jgi:hypothetical protein
MYITPVTLNCTQTFYGIRNLSWKIQVHKLQFIKTQNQSHHWLASQVRTSENTLARQIDQGTKRFEAKTS